MLPWFQHTAEQCFDSLRHTSLKISGENLWYLDKKVYVLRRQIIVTLMNSWTNPYRALHTVAEKLFLGVLTYKPFLYNRPKSEKGTLETNSWSRRWFRFLGTGFTEDHVASCRRCSTLPLGRATKSLAQGSLGYLVLWIWIFFLKAWLEKQDDFGYDSKFHPLWKLLWIQSQMTGLRSWQKSVKATEVWDW